MTESKEAPRPQLVVQPEQINVPEQSNAVISDHSDIQPKFSFGMNHVVIYGIKIKTVVVVAFVIISALICMYLYKNWKDKKEVHSNEPHDVVVNVTGNDDDDDDNNDPKQNTTQLDNDITRRLQATIEHQASQIHNLQQKIQRFNQMKEEQNDNSIEDLDPTANLQSMGQHNQQLQQNMLKQQHALQQMKQQQLQQQQQQQALQQQRLQQANQQQANQQQLQQFQQQQLQQQQQQQRQQINQQQINQQQANQQQANQQQTNYGELIDVDDEGSVDYNRIKEKQQILENFIKKQQQQIGEYVSTDTPTFQPHINNGNRQIKNDIDTDQFNTQINKALLERLG